MHKISKQGPSVTNLTLRQLTKRFGPRTVVNNCSHVFPTGTFGIVGSNGIGKSTLLSLISGMLMPDSGDILINGTNTKDDPLMAKTMISLAPNADALYPFMTGSELLKLVSAARSLKDQTYASKILEGFRLTPYTGFPFKELSEGTTHKFALTAALMGNTGILILDEPTNALDESSITFLCDEIRSRNIDSITIIATHDKRFLDSIHATQLDASALLNNSQ